MSPAKVNPPNALTAATAVATYAVVATAVELLPAVCQVAVAEEPRATVPENVLLPLIV